LVKLLLREAVLIVLAGLFVAFAAPLLLHAGAEPGLFWIGLLMSLTFMALYAVGVAGGSRLKAPVKAAVGAVAWLLAFVAGGGLDPARHLLPAALVLLPLAAGALRHGLPGLADGLFLYSLPMVGVRWGLVPMLGGGAAPALVVMAAGGFYTALRATSGILWPIGRAEGQEHALPLVPKSLPDRVVGVLEGTTGLSARPFATRRDGTLDEQAISVVAPASRARSMAAAVQAALTAAMPQAPLRVELGLETADGTEIVVRRAEAPADS